MKKTQPDKIQKELGKIERALRSKNTTAATYCQLYAAQQALCWALNPNGYATPTKVILGGKVMPLMGTQEDSKGCLAARRRLRS
jgi:hypothetical protein